MEEDTKKDSSSLPHIFAGLLGDSKMDQATQEPYSV